MYSKDFILHNVRCLLKEYILPMQNSVDKPRRKFLSQMLPGILLSGSLQLKDISRWIHDGCSDIFYRIKRLANNLKSAKGSLDQALNSYRQACSRHIQHDSPISIDITDLAKPRAKKMKYLTQVYDGSESRLVTGYWCLEVYAHLKKKLFLPLAMDTFSTDDPDVISRNRQIYRTVRAVHEALNGKGIWVADRGFDGLNVYETWFSLNSNFIVRQVGNRDIITSNNVRINQVLLIEHLRQAQMYANQQTDIVFTKVRLPSHQRWLYLVAEYRRDFENPLILMTTMVVENLQQAKHVIWYYLQRWGCEESGRFLKTSIGLERFCLRRYESIKRLMILAMFAMGFLTWILINRKRLTKSLFDMTSRFRQKSKFKYYRLLEGLQQFIIFASRSNRKLPILTN